MVVGNPSRTELDTGIGLFRRVDPVLVPEFEILELAVGGQKLVPILV